jgi:hypothetical protein
MYIPKVKPFIAYSGDFGFIDHVKNNYSFELKRNLSELKALCEHLINFGQITGDRDVRAQRA